MNREAGVNEIEEAKYTSVYLRKQSPHNRALAAQFLSPCRSVLWLLTGHRDGPESLTDCVLLFPESKHEFVTTCDSQSNQFSSILSGRFPWCLGKSLDF